MGNLPFLSEKFKDPIIFFHNIRITEYVPAPIVTNNVVFVYKSGICGTNNNQTC